MVLLPILPPCDTSWGDSSGGQTVETQTWPSGWEYQGVCFAHVSDDSDCVYTSDGDEHPLDDADSIKVSQYHYQLWNDPPPGMVQRRLEEVVQQAAVTHR